jgi:predicted alpha/beta-hydrolase family hydrolase
MHVGTKAPECLKRLLRSDIAILVVVLEFHHEEHTVLIVAHTETIPRILEGLGVLVDVTIDQCEFANLLYFAPSSDIGDAMATDFKELRSKSSRATVLFAHGAGAPMDSPGMTAIAEALASEGFRVVQFEFSYMAARRSGGSRKPPPRGDKLIPEYHAAIDDLQSDCPLIIGGKSMGGRVASLIADELFQADRISGLLCVGYPFHPPNKPEQLRTVHLKSLRTPTLFCQGKRDQFGSVDEVSCYALSSSIELVWFEDGDHDLKPRKRVSGFTHEDHMKTMAQSVSAWVKRIGF